MYTHVILAPAWFLASVLRSVTAFPVDRVDPLNQLTSSQIVHSPMQVGLKKIVFWGPKSGLLHWGERFQMTSFSDQIVHSPTQVGVTKKSCFGAQMESSEAGRAGERPIYANSRSAASAAVTCTIICTSCIIICNFWPKTYKN